MDIALVTRDSLDPDALLKRQGHKFTHGHALVVCGGAGRTGAARLSARGALRIGAGLVTLAVPPKAMPEVAAQVTAVMVRDMPDAAALAEILEDQRLTAVCIGPGLGLGEQQAELVRTALGSGRAMVLDADALTLVAREDALYAALHRSCVLTPHDGEFARLFPKEADRLSAPAESGPAYSRLDAAVSAATAAGCVVLLKGPDTIIAAPDGRVSIHAAHYERSAPWLATAGAGDVLAGFIAGLLARGIAPFEAAEAAAWLHVETALHFGPGLIAEDLPETLPAILRSLGS
ncbi:NAD(P)H-hydrate dehydratase [Sulfitobacter sp. LCG007]